MMIGKQYIGGAWVKGQKTRTSINPATEEIIGRVYCADMNSVKTAVNAARESFDGWSNLSVWERAKYLKKMAELIVKRADNLKQLITAEMGRPLFESEIEVYETADMITFFAEEGKACLDGETLPINSALFPNKFSFTIQNPIGVVGIIKPWNYPLELPFWSIAPAILAGNTIVFKPSELTPFVGIEIAKIGEEAGLPEGVLNVIHGDEIIGKQLVKSDVDMISFTGSNQTGKKIMKNSSENLHKLSLELGGSDPFIVLPSSDIEEAVNGAVWGRFTNCGQVCVSAKRIILLEEIYDIFIDKFLEKVKLLKLGSGDNVSTDIGPLASEKQRDILIRQVSDAIEKGATLECGGKIPTKHKKGYFYEPTVLTNVNKNMKILNEEVFGPVASIIKVKSVDDAVRIANDSVFGLGASLWTTDIDDAFNVANRIKSGTVWINEINVAYPNCPWGGLKNSGVGTELGKKGLLEYTVTKHINIDFSKNETREWWFPYKK